MASGWQYRIYSAVGTAVIAGFALFVGNHPLIQELLFAGGVPALSQLNPAILSGDELLRAYLTTALVNLGAMVPLIKPIKRQILDKL